MNKSLIIKVLLSLLGDGEALDQGYYAALDILLPEHEKPLLKQKHTVFQLLETLRKVNEDQQTTLVLRAVLLGLRLQEPVVLERSKRLAAHLNIDIEKAERYLETFVSQRLASTPSIKEFLHPPGFIQHIRDLLYPNPIKRVAHISPVHYRHPKDVEATTALEKNYPFEALARLVSKELSEKAMSIQNSANAIKVDNQQFPQLHHRFQNIAKRLGIHPIPDLFLAKGPLNAYTAGVENTFVVLQEGAISQLSAAELDFVIGHELGHVKFEHVLYQMIAQLAVAQGMLLSPNMLLGRIVGMGMSMAIRDWARKAELSCDRAGLLACQNPHAAIKVMLRFAGVPPSELEDFNIEAYLAQYETFTQESNSGLGRLFQGLNNTHPWIIERIQAIRLWIEEGHYQSLLSESPLETTASQHSFERAPLLRLLNLPKRWTESLQAQSDPICWIIGERENERGKLLNLWSKSEPNFISQQDFRDQPPILPGDAVLYSLHASALLSSTERTQIEEILQIPHIHLALGVWGFNNQEDELTDEEDTAELESRLQEYIAQRPIKVLYLKEDEPFQWTREEEYSIAQAQKYIFEQIRQNPIDVTEAVASQKKKYKKASLILQTGLEELRQSFPTWFEPMNLEERRHEGMKKLLDEIQSIYQNAFQHEYPSPSEVALQKRSTEISKTLVAAGIGSLGFGALILPTLPVWVIATGIGIGVASFGAGRWELQSQHEKTMKNHLRQLDEWIQINQKQALLFIESQEKKLDTLAKDVEHKGWEKSILEIEKIWEASSSNS